MATKKTVQAAPEQEPKAKVVIPKRPKQEPVVRVELRYAGNTEQAVKTVRALLKSTKRINIYIRNHNIGMETIALLIESGELLVENGVFIGYKEVYCSENSSMLSSPSNANASSYQSVTDF